MLLHQTALRDLLPDSPVLLAPGNHTNIMQAASAECCLKVVLELYSVLCAWCVSLLACCHLELHCQYSMTIDTKQQPRCTLIEAILRKCMNTATMGMAPIMWLWETYR